MTPAEKKEAVALLVEKLGQNSHFYLTDTSELNAEATSALRRKCNEKNIELIVVKNTLLKKALEQKGGDYSELYPVLKGGTSLMLTETGNLPARLIKELRDAGAKKPILKAAYVQECIYVGDNQLDALVSLKSKNELIADVVALLQSPMQTVLGQLESGKNTIGGLLKAIEEKKGA